MIKIINAMKLCLIAGTFLISASHMQADPGQINQDGGIGTDGYPEMTLSGYFGSQYFRLEYREPKVCSEDFCWNANLYIHKPGSSEVQYTVVFPKAKTLFCYNFLIVRWEDEENGFYLETSFDLDGFMGNLAFQGVGVDENGDAWVLSNDYGIVTGRSKGWE